MVRNGLLVMVILKVKHMLLAMVVCDCVFCPFLMRRNSVCSYICFRKIQVIFRGNVDST